MKSKNICFFLFSFFFNHIVTSSQVLYKNYQVWQVDLRKNVPEAVINKIDEQGIVAFYSYKLHYTTCEVDRCKDVWRKNSSSVDFLLNANETSWWDKFLQSHKISYKKILKDVQENIEKEILMKNGSARREAKMSWTTYPKSLKEVYKFLDDVAASNRKDCTLSVIGKTAHKRDIKMLKLSNGKKTNQGILIDAGMHGREWTTIVSVLYFIDNIARNFSAQPEYVTNNDWYIIPVLNPDGYDYSLTVDRLWKKNRRFFSGPCDGVDINRNFDYDWCDKGSSDIICSHNYCGIEAFSEAESKALKDLTSGRHFFSYINMHSNGRKILFPWAAGVAPTQDIKTHKRVSKNIADAMFAVNRQVFRTGSVARSGEERGSGMAVDWMYSQGIKHSYVIETRGEDVGGFFLEPAHLILAVKEVYAGLMQLARVI